MTGEAVEEKQTLAQSLVEPGPGVGPPAFGSGFGDAQNLGGLINSAQAAVQQFEGSSSDFLTQLGASVDTKWVKMDKKALESAGQDTSFFDQIDLGSTVNPAAVFDKAKSVKDLGFDEVDGEKVKHYEVTVAAADIATMDKLLQQQLDQIGGDLPDDIVYDMYVTEDNEIRRIAYELDLGVTDFELGAVGDCIITRPLMKHARFARTLPAVSG